ncbi:glycosyltransferase family 2 protein [Chloroflexota bacterium]
MVTVTQRDGDNQVRVCAIMAAYNESETIAKVIQQTKKYVDKVIVIDDGSTDNTAEIARKSGAEISLHGINRGPGAAVQTGYSAAISEGFDYIVQIDADGQHDPKYIPKLLETAVNGNYDVVIGSRFLNKSYKNWPLIKKTGIILLTRAVNLLSSANITDAVSGFKVHKASSLKLLSKASNRFPAAEQIMGYAEKGMRIKEISIEMPLRNNGTSYLSYKKLAIYPFVVIRALIKVKLYGKEGRDGF